jgi:hypothetical protein
MAVQLDHQEPSDSTTPDDTDQPVFQRHRRARRLAEQSWGEFFREMLLVSAVAVVAVAFVTVVVALYRR